MIKKPRSRTKKSPDPADHVGKSARLEAIINSMLDGIVTIDHLGIVESFNPGAERIFGYRPDEVIGQNVKMLMPAPFADEHDGYLKNYMDTGDAKVIGIGREVAGRRRDSTIFPLDLRLRKCLGTATAQENLSASSATSLKRKNQKT